MKKYLVLIISILTCPMLMAGGAPKWMKKARLSQVTVVAYDEADAMHEAQGVLTGDGQTVITEYDVLKGAVRAKVIDQVGHEFEVSRIAGASAMYNVAKATIQVGKEKMMPMPLSAAAPAAGATLYVLPVATANDKGILPTEAQVEKAETFREHYGYYTLTTEAGERLAGCPVLNEEGQMVGLLQRSATGDGKAYAIDASFVEQMKTAALDANSNDLRSIRIAKQIPDEEGAASTYLFLLQSQDPAAYAMAVDDFIRQFPSNTNGYIMKAEYQVATGQLAGADSTYRAAAEVEGLKRDELSFSHARAIYDLCLRPGQTAQEGWTMADALTLCQQAYAENPLPLYQQQEAKCLYATKEYAKAADLFLALTKTNMRTPDLFMYAAQCKAAMEADAEESLALMDSAVACFTKPYPAEAAGIIIVRAKMLAEAGKNREAVAGYNDYEHLAPNAVSPQFYYEKEQLELKCRMYPAALSDIEKAIRLSPQEVVFYAECAALNFRVGQVDDAIHYAEQAVKLDQKFPDAYRILGVCYSQKGDKAKARENLQKAVDLGDPLAQGVLEKLN